MVTTILVPLDGSELAARALPYAIAIARATRARLVLLHARMPLLMSEEMPFDLEPAVTEVIADGLLAEARTIEGYEEELGDLIRDAAAEHRACLIVMSTHGRGGLGRWLYGSVADRVLRRADVPVLLVPAASERTWPAERTRRILVPLDGSSRAEEALNRASALAQGLDAELLLLHVVDPPSVELHGASLGHRSSWLDSEVHQRRAYLDRVAASLATLGLAAGVRVELGTPAATIAQVAREEGVDLIAMATRGRGGLARWLLGSVATEALHRAGVPLLLVRPRAVRAAAQLGDAEPLAATNGAGSPVAQTTA